MISRLDKTHSPWSGSPADPFAPISPFDPLLVSQSLSSSIPKLFMYHYFENQEGHTEPVPLSGLLERKGGAKR